MATKTEAPAQPAPPQQTIVSKMAMEDYFQILLAENSGDFKWGDHYVGINEYSMFLPREKSMLVAASIMELLDDANVSIKYHDADGKPQITRRKDVQIMERRGPFSAEQAHAKRLDGTMPVFPTKIPRASADELSARLSSKKGS